MQVLVLGSGGREHALCWKIARSPACAQLYCAPGNAGIATVACILDLAVDCGEGGGLVVQVGGAPGETVTMLLRPPRGAVVARSCTAGQDGKCSIAAGG